MDIKFTLTVFITITLLANLVLATTIPGIPHAFYGAVTWNGNPAPDGTTVTAKIDGIEVSSTTTKDGKYGYDPVFYVDDPNNDRSGDEIRFFINGIDTGQTKYFCNGCSTKLNLAASGPSPPSPPSPPSTPSGPGPSPSPPPTEEPEEEPEEEGEEIIIEECEERWVCTDWSSCVNKIQTRECADENNCGTEENRPFESQPCGKEEEEEAVPTPLDQLTGMLATITERPEYLLILGLIIIAIILIIFRSRLKPLKKKGLAFLAKINFKSKKK